MFGEHLGADNDLPYAVVESAKTAALMDHVLPIYNWVATNSAGQLEKKCKALIGRKVILFPDHNQYDKNTNWKAIGDKYGFEVSKDCEHWHKAGLIADKDDIADYYLKNYSDLMKPKKIDPEWNDFVDDNPDIPKYKE